MILAKKDASMARNTDGNFGYCGAHVWAGPSNTRKSDSQSPDSTGKGTTNNLRPYGGLTEFSRSFARKRRVRAGRVPEADVHASNRSDGFRADWRWTRNRDLAEYSVSGQIPIDDLGDHTCGWILPRGIRQEDTAHHDPAMLSNHDVPDLDKGNPYMGAIKWLFRSFKVELLVLALLFIMFSMSEAHGAAPPDRLERVVTDLAAQGVIAHAEDTGQETTEGGFVIWIYLPQRSARCLVVLHPTDPNLMGVAGCEPYTSLPSGEPKRLNWKVIKS